MLFLFIAKTTLFAQTNLDKRKLEAQKKENIQKINELNKIIATTSQKKEASVGQLNVISEKIQTQDKQISILSENQKILSNEAEELTKVTIELNANLAKLKQEYTQKIRQTAKTSNRYNKLSFLFSTKTFNQLIRNFQHLRQYSEKRKQQSLLITKVRSDLIAEQMKVLQKKKEQAVLINDKLLQTQHLESLKNEQTLTVKQLAQKEKQLKDQLRENKKSVAVLESMIARIVEREITKSKVRSQSKSKQNNKNTLNNNEVAEKTDSRKEINMNDEETKIASSFSALRGRMPWPVNSGFISSKFGTHPHPVLKSVKVVNLGIDIQTVAGNDVKSVYNGLVLQVIAVPGANNMVMIQHGDYFTVYSKLSNVTVSTGDKVNAGQKIGDVATDNDGTSEINFQVWRNFSKQNPETWLKRR